MQQWEYLIIGLSWANKAWRAQYINGDEVINWQNSQPLYDLLQKSGHEGWELVNRVVTRTEGSAMYQNAEGYSLIFKRPRA